MMNQSAATSVETIKKVQTWRGIDDDNISFSAQRIKRSLQPKTLLASHLVSIERGLLAVCDCDLKFGF